MKKVQKVSISGFSFTLEEAAYESLSRYLGRLELHYQNREDGKDIVEGIEERLAELLAEGLKDGVNVVSEAQVARAVEILGTPEAIEAEGQTEETGPDGSYGAEGSEAAGFEAGCAGAHSAEAAGSGAGRSGRSGHGDRSRNAYFKPEKRLHRDVDNRVFFGVLSGLSAFCKIDPVLLRLLYSFFTLTFIFTKVNGAFVGMVALYFLLALIVPAARTVAQKCAMRGEPLSAKNIEDTVAQAGAYEPKPRRENRFWRTAGRALAICLGIVALCVAFPVLLALIGILLFAGIFVGALPVLPFTLLMPFPAGWVLVFKICFFLLILIPILWLIYMGCKLIFNFNTGPNRRHISLGMFIVWTLALVMLIVAAGNTVTRTFPNQKVHQLHTTFSVCPPTDTLVVELNYPSALTQEYCLYRINNNKYNLGWLAGEGHESQVCFFPRIRIAWQNGTEADAPFELKGSTVQMVSKSQRFLNSAPTPQHPELRVEEGGRLRLSPQVVDIDNQWNGSYEEVEIKVPQGKVLLIKGPVEQIYDGSDTRISREENITKYLGRRILHEDCYIDFDDLIFR